MSEKLSERTIAEGIVSRWIAAFRDDLGGKNARERLADLIHVALEQQLAAKDVEIARLRAAMQGISKYVDFYMKREVESPSNHQDMAREAGERWATFNAALAETPAAPEVK